MIRVLDWETYGKTMIFSLERGRFFEGKNLRKAVIDNLMKVLNHLRTGNRKLSNVENLVGWMFFSLEAEVFSSALKVVIRY